MINKIEKMRSAQRKVEKFLYENGYELVWFIHHTRWSKDIFGLFDGFAIKEGVVVFFQVKSNEKPNMKPFREFFETYKIPVKVFVVKDRKGVYEISL